MIKSAVKPELPTSDGLPARRCVLDILSSILLQKKTLDEAFDLSRAFLTLDPRDKGFVRMLVSTILRRKGQMDDLIRRALTRGEARPETLKIILYIGIGQLLFMDVPDHAAVDTSVRLAESQNLSARKAL